MTHHSEIRRVTLRDGRTLAWAEYGDPAGQPVLYFHGFPGSRLEPLMPGEAQAWARVRLIVPDRPGFGHSTFQPGRRLLDWPDDVTELGDSLGLDRFACMGVSGGGPYAIACAFRLPGRLTRTAVVCGIGPVDTPEGTRGMMLPNRLLFTLSRYSQTVGRLAIASMSRLLRRDPQAALARLRRFLPEPDRAVLDRPELLEWFVMSNLEAVRQGTRAAGQESQLFARPWGFRLADVAAEIDLYQGEQDVNVAPAMGHHQARALGSCKAHFFPDEGHLSLVINRMDEILQRLVS